MLFIFHPGASPPVLSLAPMPDDDAPPTLGQSVLLWMLLSVIFVAAGGMGAGVTALLYESVMGDQFGNTLYAVIFGGVGLVAYRTARSYLGR